MRLIDADALMDSHVVTTSNKDVIMRKITLHEISEAPTIEAEPVVHARWVQLPYFRSEQQGYYSCSRCGRAIHSFTGAGLKSFPYCHCGARMDEEEPSNG